MTEIKFACDVLITHTTEGTEAAPIIGSAMEDILNAHGWTPTDEPGRWRLPDSEGLPANWHTIGEAGLSLTGIGLEVVVNTYN